MFTTVDENTQRTLRGIRRRAEVSEALRQQLPESLRDLFVVTVVADSYFLHGQAVFIHNDGRSFSTEIHGLPHDPRLPATFAPWLCLQPRL